ncbi:MAG: insulinase family protein [Planctomycetota bacterium]
MILACLGVITLLQAGIAEPRIERLDSGLRVVILEDHTLPLASVQLWYQVGSAYDATNTPGLCHITRTILEHQNDAALRLRAAGINFESHTLRDACYFSSVLPPDFLEYTLKIEARRMAVKPATPEILAEGLAAAARDFGLEPEDDHSQVERRLLGAMFPKQPTRHPPGFVTDKLKTVEPDDINEFFERWFVPGNAVLMIIGDVSTPTTLELVRQHFGPLAWREPPHRFEYASPPAERIDAGLVTTAQAGIDLAWLTPPAGYFENAGIDVLMHYLCNPIDGTLYQDLSAAGYSLNWNRHAWRDHGVLTLTVDATDAAAGDTNVAAGLRPGREGEAPAEPNVMANGSTDRLQTGPTDVAAGVSPAVPITDIEQRVQAELKHVAASVPDEIAFNRARALAARDMANGRAAFSDRALRLAWHEVIAGDMQLAAYEQPRVAHLAVGDMQDAARELLEARTVILTRRTEATDQPEMSAALPPPLKSEYPTQLDSGAALELLAQHATDVPPLKSPKSPATLTTHELDNGVKITVCRIPGLEPVEVRTLAQPAYSIFRGAEAAMAMGSTRHTVRQVRDYLSYHGLDIYPALGDTRSGLTSRGPTTHVAQLIELQAKLLRYPNHDPDAIQGAVTRGLALRKWLEQTDHGDVYQYYLPPGFLGWTAGMRPIVDAQRLSENLAELDEVHDVQLLVVGDVEPQSVMAAATRVWSDWTTSAAARARQARPKSRHSPTTDAFPTSTGWIELADTPPSLYIGDHLWPSDLEPPAREWTDRLTRRLLGAAQWSDPQTFWPPTLDATRAWRWMCVPLRSPDLVHLYARVPTDQVASTFEECLARLERLQHGTIPPAQIATALRLVRVDQLLARDSSSAIADVLGREIGRPWLLPDVVDPTQVSALIARYFRPSARVIMVRGPDDLSAELRQFESTREESQPAPDSPLP